jgi:uncharacterized protein
VDPAMNSPCQFHGPLELLVIQPTPFCNIDCSYCYLANRASKARMTETTLEHLFKSVFSSSFVSDRLTVLWHAGEPLIVGIDYYRRAFDIIDSLNPGVSVRHSIQTNGTLIDQDWIDFLSPHHVKLGISLDGPPHLHDRHRRTRLGRGTFDRVMQSVQLLRDNAFPFHVITVLTRDSLSAARELFAFYVNNGITDVAFNIEEIEGAHPRSSMQGEDVTAEVKTFFRDFLALTQKHSSKLEVREFAGVFGMISTPDAFKYGNPQTEPMRIVTVGVNGELSTFSPELMGFRTDRYPSFVFSSVYERGLSGILTNDNFEVVCADIRRGVEKCKQSCEYFEICLGGAPANKLFENGSFDSTDTIHCRLSKQALIDVAIERIEGQLEVQH